MSDEQSLNTDLLGLPPNTYVPTALEAVSAGMPLCQSAVAENAGKVMKASAVAALGGRNANVVGLAVRGAAAGARVHAQYSDLLQLPTANWDAITGGSGGLTRGAPYYVSAGANGHITTTPPNGGGDFVAPIGIATSPTTMRILLSVAKGV